MKKTIQVTLLSLVALSFLGLEVQVTAAQGAGGGDPPQPVPKDSGKWVATEYQLVNGEWVPTILCKPCGKQCPYPKKC